MAVVHNTASTMLATETTEKKAVTFGSVRLHTHRRILGDNPFVSEGLPVSLDWAVESSDHYTLVAFERLQKKYRDLPAPRKMGARQREKLLTETGHSRSSFVRVQNEITNILAQSETMRTLMKPQKPAPFIVRLLHARIKDSSSKRNFRSNRVSI